MYIKPIKKEELDRYLAVPDLSLPSSDHAIALIYRMIHDHIKRTHPDSEIREYRLSPIVSVADNYDNLLFEPESAGRSSTYTHYLSEDTMLRAHTTAHIPKILAELAKDKTWNDVVIMIPGLVYRRDVTDKKHLGVIHHLDIWRIAKIEKNIKRYDLKEVVEGIARTCNKSWKLRIVDVVHPYTLDGMEVNLVKDDKDVEILECGMLHPEVVRMTGLNPDEVCGWAMGIGLDRMVMIVKDISDIRYLRSTNSKIAQQMLNLEPYKEVSSYPPITRDLSYCVPATYVEEDISDDIRNALGKDIEILEDVTILTSTEYSSLPEIAKEKLGCKPDQKNVLVRITLRHLEKTLTDKEANDYYATIYTQVNKGTAGYL